MTVRVGVVCLGEAANLGDDLILIAVVRAVHSALPGARIDFLSHGSPLPWVALADLLGLPDTPTGIRVRTDLGPVHDRKKVFADADVVVFGGGGLLQSSHRPDPVYEWLSYLPRGAAVPPVLAVGHGIGPLSERWIERLRDMGPLLNESWVRDRYSLAIATDELEWPTKLCNDFVTPELVRRVSARPVGEPGTDAPLGVALRHWPGLPPTQVAAHIRTVADRHGCRRIHYWVLESGSSVDTCFVDQVMSEVDRANQFKNVYEPSGITDFLGGMSEMSVAISMKLHSSAIWDAFGVPMYPIVYAPKVASFFGVEWQGLSMLDRPVEPSRPDPSTPSAAAVVAERLGALADGDRVRRSGLHRSERVRFQLLRSLNSLSIRLPGRRGGIRR